jgi:glycosyltransferase involved in cell wall biosynthesis
MASVAHVTTIAESLKLLLLDQLRTIQHAGYAVTGVSAPGPATEALDAAGIRHVPAPFVRASGLTPLSDLRVLGALVQQFRRERYTIVHTHTAKPDLYAAIAARLARVPIVVTTLHGFYFHELMPPRTRRMFAELARIGMRCADAVLSQNPEDVELAIREGLCPAEKIEYLGNGIDMTRFDRARLDPELPRRYRAELGIPEDAPVIGFVGRLVRDKGILELLEAIRRVRARHPHARVVLVGMVDKAKADVIEPATAARYGVADICHFLGHRDDMPELYAFMDVFVLPSHREAFPRSIMEAAAMGVPVIATRVRGCRTTVQDGSTGLLVPLNDPPALAQALDALLSDATRRRQMGHAGRLRAVKEFDQRAVFAKVLATYDRLLGARRA